MADIGSSLEENVDKMKKVNEEAEKTAEEIEAEKEKEKAPSPEE